MPLVYLPYCSGHEALITAGILIYYHIQILQQLRGTSPLLTMAQLSPVAISGFIAAITTGHVISRIGPGWVMLISMLAFLVGSVLTATMPVHETYWKQAFVVTLIIPWGMDMSFPAGTLIMSDAVQKRYVKSVSRLYMHHTLTPYNKI
jgi:Na+/melibiose symporter-like transporter